MKTYKVTDNNMMCRGFQYELGKLYTIEKKPIRCTVSGFHSCVKAVDCFNYYDFDPNNRVFECEAGGEIDVSTDDSKIASSEITLLRELTWSEVLELVNTGKSCTGMKNSGNWNSGDGNSGDGNSGNRNSGDWNSGNRNSGNWNSGDWNSGNRNSGDGNSGNRNSGNWNSGDYNSCSHSSGYFNSVEPEIIMFNKPTGLKRSQIDIPYIELILNEWIDYTRAEKEADPSKALIGGYLKTYTYKEAWANWDKRATYKQRKEIMALPNFDFSVFEEITGLDWRQEVER